MPRVSEDYLAARRSQIMDAAIVCFSREGFHRTTMQDIVAETGLSAGAIYRYFPAKEDIVAAIAEERHRQEVAVLEEAGGGRGDLRGALQRLARASLGRLTDPEEQRRRRLTVQIWGEALRDERVMEIVRGGLDEPIAIISELVRRAQATGELSGEVDPEAFARVCAAIFQGLVLQQAWDPSLDVDAYTAGVLALVDGLVGAPAR